MLATADVAARATHARYCGCGRKKLNPAPFAAVAEPNVGTSCVPGKLFANYGDATANRHIFCLCLSCDLFLMRLRFDAGAGVPTVGAA